MISRALIARAFGRAASHYDRHADLQRQVADQLLSLLEPEFTVTTMVDLGCGTGYCSSKLREKFPAGELLALDIALPMLLTTKQHGLDDCALVCADIQALPLRANQFDLVVSNLTIQWCPRIEALFAELFRITQPGAKILLSTFGPATLREVKTAWARIDNYVHVNEFVSAATLIQQAEAAGFLCNHGTTLIQRPYASMHAVGKELKGLGAYNMNSEQAQGFTSRKALARAEQIFAEGRAAEARTAEGVPVTFEIFYLDLNKPDSKE
jgi:malonyl-CoA O-methyltransferase